jgi:peroxiredoxin
MRAYQAGLALFERTNTRILGASTNTAAKNKKFADALGLSFPLLSDTSRQLSKLYGVLNFFRLSNRATFVIDKDGVIRAIFRGRQALDPKPVLEACRALPGAD